MIVRAEDRGLGILTWEAWRALQPAETLAIDMGDWARGFRPQRDRYPGAWWTGFDGYAPAGALTVDRAADVFDGCDVVWSAETFYDWRLPVELHRRGIRTVLTTMPEFHRPECNIVGNVWLPTPWRQEHHPGAPLIPVGVALDRWPTATAAPADDDGPLRVLHVAGHRAAMDRNGTGIVVEALARCREPIHVTIRTQDPEVAAPRPSGSVTVDVQTGTVGPYWDAYAGHHVLLMPRRYGGLCLPVQEACGAGLAIVMTACSPNYFWPIDAVWSARSSTLHAPAGEVTTYQCDPSDVAAAIDRLARDRTRLASRMAASRAWAEAFAWDQIAPHWMEHFDLAV